MSAGEEGRATVRVLYAKWEMVRRLTRSWRLERARLVDFVRLAGDRAAMEITPEVWAELRLIRMSEPSPRTGKPVHAATLDTELMRAKQMYRWATKLRLLPFNPLAEAQGSRARTERETWLNWEQVETLLQAAQKNPFLHAGILVAVATGLRLGEMLTLRHDRIGGDGLVTIASAQTKSKRKRIVALSPRALETVRALPRHWSSPVVFWSTQRKGPAHEKGQPLHPSTIELWFRAVVERCGLDAVCAPGDKRLRWHDLRHTHASLADAAGAKPTAISEQLGHAELRTTQRYMHREQRTRALEIAELMTTPAADPVPAASEVR